MSKLSSETRRETMLGFQPPAIGDEEIAAVAETLRSGWLTTGPRAAELERRMAEYLQAEHVLALAPSTAALHLALVGLGSGPGDEVITTTITWPATVKATVQGLGTALFAYGRALELDAHHADARVNLGRLLHEQGLVEEAERHYRLALRENPEHATAAYNLGIALEDLGRAADAIEAYRAALAADPRLADAHYNV